jgi:hypothetical protein
MHWSELMKETRTDDEKEMPLDSLSDPLSSLSHSSSSSSTGFCAALALLCLLKSRFVFSSSFCSFSYFCCVAARFSLSK